MKSENKRMTYMCSYNKEEWSCEIKDVNYTKQITGFTVSGRGSSYRVYLVELGRKRWLDIPVLGLSSELSGLDDVFWNSEKLASSLNSIIDGLTIAKGLKMIQEIILFKEE